MPESEYGPTKPLTEEQHHKLLDWFLRAYRAAREDRRHREPGWEKDYRLYRSWVDKPKQDWQSRAFIPESYTAVETILPHMIAQLPGFTAEPIGFEDEAGAELYDLLFARAKNKSKLHMHLFDTLKETAIYGTGILKVFPDEIKRTDTVMEPVFETETMVIEEQLIDPETNQPLRDPDGNPTMQEREVENSIPVGMEPQETEVVDYYGPMYKCVDIFRFLVAPDAPDVQSARYVIHEDYQDIEEIQRKVDEGIYFWPTPEVAPSEVKLQALKPKQQAERR